MLWLVVTKRVKVADQDGGTAACKINYSHMTSVMLVGLLFFAREGCGKVAMQCKLQQPHTKLTCRTLGST